MVVAIAEQGTRVCKCEYCLVYLDVIVDMCRQKQDAKTIEGDFFEALVKAGAISAENATDHRKVDVQRSARTDAGVHAAGNV